MDTKYFPLDCFGEIFSFISKPTDFLNLMMVSKRVFKFAQESSSQCSSNLEFVAKYIPITQLPYVTKLKIPKPRFESDPNEVGKFESNIFLKFPNLKELKIKNYAQPKNKTMKMLDDGIFQYLGNLTSLKLINCKGFQGNGIHHLSKNLRFLEVNCSVEIIDPRLENKFMSWKKDKEKEFIGKNVASLKNLRTLILKSINGCDTTMFKDLSKLEVLKLDNCRIANERYQKYRWYFDKILFQRKKKNTVSGFDLIKNEQSQEDHEEENKEKPPPVFKHMKDLHTLEIRKRFGYCGIAYERFFELEELKKLKQVEIIGVHKEFKSESDIKEFLDPSCKSKVKIIFFPVKTYGFLVKKNHK